MATYYVRLDGSDSNTGTGPGINQAWQTIQKALGATSGVVGGDTIYIAPGHYLEQVTVGFSSPSSTVQIIGDVTASQFSGVNAGVVRLSGYSSAGNAAIVYSGFILKATSKNNLSFRNMIFEGRGDGISYGTALIAFDSCQNCSFTKCFFSQQGYNGAVSGAAVMNFVAPTSLSINATISKCIFESAGLILALDGNNVADTTSIKDCIFFGGRFQISAFETQCVIQNCTFSGATQNSIILSSGSASFKSQIRNNLFLWCLNGIQSTSTSHQDEDYNRFIGTSVARNTVSTGSNSSTVGSSRLDYGYRRLVGLSASDFWTPEQGSPNQGFGTATESEATDVYSTAWVGATPDAGYQTYTQINALTPTYQPTERNASTITIAPGSTSQSIELYLGATGLTASTSGLTARYNRTRTASVSIPLVARTIAQAWTSGGFAEVDATNMPGLYRLDLPDAAFAAGASDVTIVVRGASGTNGAVLTVTLSSGGLTAAQTASAVWGASVVGYNTATDFGGLVNQIDNTVTGIDAEVQDIPSNVWEELRVNHDTAGSFGEYVNAELVTPVTSAALVRMGPFEVRADGLGASDPLDIQKGAQHGIDIQCVDNNGAGIDITSATVTAKVYNSGATLVDTYSCTATYAADGRATFTIDTTVTNTPGTYTATITRTTGASDTQIFGPLRIYVRDI
jgi:hypothetical protein